MTPAQIIAKARLQAYVDSTMYPDAQALLDLNFVYQDIISEIITRVDEDYFWNIGKAPTVIWQEEYTITEIWETPDNFKINQINKVFIKYTEDWWYTKATRVNPASLEFDSDWYKSNQCVLNPFFYIQDKSVFLFPAPTKVIADWLKIHTILQPQDLSLAGTEDSIKIDQRFHRYLIDWMLPLIYQSRWMINEATNFNNLYEISKTRLIWQTRINRY